MKMTIAFIATMLTALPMLPPSVNGQTPQKGSTFTVAGHPGEAQLVQINGKSYIEVETLARLTQGTLSFKANETILTLNPPTAEVQPSAPPTKPALSRAFIQAAIEELSVVREWQTAIVNAVQSNAPLMDDLISARHRLAEKNLALASAAVSTDDDHSAYPLLATEYNNMQKLSDLYIAMRNQNKPMSPEEFGNSALEDQILSCAQGFQSMTESHEFQDQSNCH